MLETRLETKSSQIFKTINDGEEKNAKRTRSRSKRWRKDSTHQTVSIKLDKNLGEEENEFTLAKDNSKSIACVILRGTQRRDKFQLSNTVQTAYRKFLVINLTNF